MLTILFLDEHSWKLLKKKNIPIINNLCRFYNLYRIYNTIAKLSSW